MRSFSVTYTSILLPLFPFTPLFSSYIFIHQRTSNKDKKFIPLCFCSPFSLYFIFVSQFPFFVVYGFRPLLCLLLYLSIYLCVYLSPHIPVSLSIYLYVYLSPYIPVSLNIYVLCLHLCLRSPMLQLVWLGKSFVFATSMGEWEERRERRKGERSGKR